MWGQALITDDGVSKKNLMKAEWCQWEESNFRPRAYESPALPLSYTGIDLRSERANWIGQAGLSTQA